MSGTSTAKIIFSARSPKPRTRAFRLQVISISIPSSRLFCLWKIPSNGTSTTLNRIHYSTITTLPTPLSRTKTGRLTSLLHPKSLHRGSFSSSASMSLQPFPSTAPPLPPGKDKHHIVVLEGIHAQMPSFSFPHTITIHPNSTSSQIAERIRDATIAISCVVPITPSDMDQAPHLGVLAVMAVGISWVDKADCARRGVTVTKCPAGNVDAVGEHFLALYFAVRKRVVQVHNTITTTSDWVQKATLTKLWPHGPPQGCGQEKLGILGFGNLGTRVEKLARGIGFGDVVISERKGAREIRTGRLSFDEALATCSVIVLTLPKEDDTVDLIGEKELRSMRDDAIIINIARGGIVNEAALAKALKEGWIAGAAVDVLETEPGGVGTSPLLPDVSKADAPVPNLTVSSHIAWFTQSTIVRYQQLLKEGIEGWVNGTLREAEDRVHKTVVVHDGKIWS